MINRESVQKRNWIYFLFRRCKRVWKKDCGLTTNPSPVSQTPDPITFVCLGTDDYMDLSKTILMVGAKVTKADGTNLDVGEKVGIVNNFLHSLFKQVDVFLKENK